MSREEDNEKIYHLYKAEKSGEQTVLEVLEQAVTYGRSTPDREVLKRLVCAVSSWHSPEELETAIDEFLTLENQRGENVLK